MDSQATTLQTTTGVEERRHYLIEELLLLLEIASSDHNADLFKQYEREIIASLVELSSSHPESALAFCKHMSRKDDWYKADSLFVQKKRRQVLFITPPHPFNPNPLSNPNPTMTSPIILPLLPSFSLIMHRMTVRLSRRRPRVEKK